MQLHKLKAPVAGWRKGKSASFWPKKPRQGEREQRGRRDKQQLKKRLPFGGPTDVKIPTRFALNGNMYTLFTLKKLILRGVLYCRSPRYLFVFNCKG